MQAIRPTTGGADAATVAAAAVDAAAAADGDVAVATTAADVPNADGWRRPESDAVLCCHSMAMAAAFGTDSSRRPDRMSPHWSDRSPIHEHCGVAAAEH